MIHPTAIDASLHLGASLSHLQDSGAVVESPVLRVPAGLEAYSRTSKGPIQSQSRTWAIVSNLNNQPYNAALSSYSLGESNNVMQGHLADLLAKPMQDTIAEKSAILPKETQLMYTLHWKAVSISQSAKANAHALGLYLPNPFVWQRVTAKGGPLWRTSMRRGSSTPASSLFSLHFMHYIIAEGVMQGAQYRLHTITDQRSPAGRPEGLGNALAVGAAEGILKTAAQEQPRMSWQAMAESAFAHAPRLAELRVDAFGARSLGSVISLPQMLPRQSVQARNEFGDEHKQPRCILISGGTGEIGMLVALQMSRDEAQHIILASRSGHIPLKYARRVVTVEHFTATRCDIGSADEANHCSITNTATMLRSVMHAGRSKSIH